MSSFTAKDLETLRRQAQEVEQLLRARRTAVQTAYRQRQTELAADRENALRQAYVTQQQALCQLPGQLAANGINGGLAESSLVQLARAYGNRRSDIAAQYEKSADQLRRQQAADDAGLEEDAARSRMEYLGAYSALQAQLAKQQAPQTGTVTASRRRAAGGTGAAAETVKNAAHSRRQSGTAGRQASGGKWVAVLR